jgi:hypothetical protein
MEFKVNDLIEWKDCPGILGDFKYGPIREILPDGTMRLGFVKGIVHPKDCELLNEGSPEHEKARKFWELYQRY